MEAALWFETVYNEQADFCFRLGRRMLPRTENIEGGRLEGVNKAENGTGISFFIMPPQEGWMEEIRYVYQMIDGNDWTFDIQLETEQPGK